MIIDHSAHATHAKNRQTINAWIDAAIPRLYGGVYPVPEGRDPEAVLRAAILTERLLHCADPFEVVRLAEVAARLILTEPGAVVLITGSPGVGKSSLATLILRILVELIWTNDWEANPITSNSGLFRDPDGLGLWNSRGVMWTSAFELFDTERGGGTSDLMRDLQRVPLAVIDDIGLEGEDARIKSTEAVVAARREGLRSTILITSKVDPPRDRWSHDYFYPLRQRYGVTFVSRVFEEGRRSAMHIHMSKKY